MENNLVTVLIPAHNRQNRLKRLVEYYSSAGIPIIIADSSDEEWEEANNLPSNVLYRYCCRMHLVDKVISVTGFIETPYVVMCADDDFITLKGISDCVKALKSAPADVNSAQGNYYRYFPMDNLRLEKIYTQMKGNSIVDDTSLKRVWHLADCYYQFYYAVYRRDFFIEAYMACLHNGEKLFQNLCIVELFLSFYSIIRGKHIVVDTNYAFREYIPDSAGTWVPNLYVVKNDPTCRVEAGNMEQALALMMSEEDNVSLQYARSEISNALDHYIGKFITPPHRSWWYNVFIFKIGAGIRKIKGLFRRKYLLFFQDLVELRNSNHNIHKESSVHPPEYKLISSLVRKYWEDVYSG